MINTKEPEQALLASLILDSSMYHVISGLITDQSFYTTKHQYIFQAITKLIKDDTAVDLVTLSDSLNGHVSRSELVNIANTVASGANAEYYAEIVADSYTRRKAILTMRGGITRAESENITDVIATVQKELDNTLPQRRTSSAIYPSIIDTVERVMDRDREKNYIETGFTKLDLEVRLTNGTLTLVAADPGAGKTSYLLGVARYMARKNKRALFFTLEMTREQILENIIAQELSISHRDMINGLLNERDMQKLSRGIKNFTELNFGVLDGRWSINEIRHQLITESRTGGVGCLMVDSLGKVKLPDGMSKTGELHKIYNVVCEELVDLAVEMDIPVLLAHHLNRDSQRRNKNRPTMGSLREAGEMWAHNVLLIHREYLYNQEEQYKNTADFIVVKARDGNVGTVEIGFDGPCKKFYNIEGYREPPPGDWWNEREGE